MHITQNWTELCTKLVNLKTIEEIQMEAQRDKRMGRGQEQSKREIV